MNWIPTVMTGKEMQAPTFFLYWTSYVYGHAGENFKKTKKLMG